MIREYELRVIRQWPGGPPRGRPFKGSASRAEQLLRIGMVEKVPVEATRVVEPASSYSSKKKKKFRKR